MSSMTIDRHGHNALSIQAFGCSVWMERRQGGSWLRKDFFTLKTYKLADGCRGFELWAGPLLMQADTLMTTAQISESTRGRLSLSFL